MPVCDCCTLSLSNKAPGVQCTGPCSKYYHGKCVELTKQDINNFQKPGVYWMCLDCRNEPERRKRQSLIINAEDNNEHSPNLMSILREIQDTVSMLNRKYEDVLDSVKFCSSKISDFEMLMNQFNKKSAEIDRISKENKDLKEAVNNLTTRLDTLDQQLRMNNLEIQGVPEKSNENLLLVLEKIGDHIECPIKSSDIDVVFRSAPNISSNNTKPIIVKFTSKQRRDAVLSAARKTRKGYNTKEKPGLCIENISSKMYINEHVTNQTKLLLKKTKEISKANNFKFVWVRDGKILARKDDKSKVISIRNEEDFKKLK